MTLYDIICEYDIIYGIDGIWTKTMGILSMGRINLGIC